LDLCQFEFIHGTQRSKAILGVDECHYQGEPEAIVICDERRDADSHTLVAPYDKAEWDRVAEFV
jgi:hypothetical protein